MNAMTEPIRTRHLDEMSPWNDRLQLLVVTGVIDEAPGVKTFTFRSGAQTWFRYLPGQFLTLELPVDDTPAMRTYTLSSSPSRPFSIAVTAKAQPGSIGTRWMFENLQPGMRLRAYGPAGGFSHHLHPAAKYLFVSAGSGVTPMMSMLRWLADCAPCTDVVLVNCARRPSALIFRQELELLDRRLPALSLRLLVTRQPRGESWPGLVGRIDAARLALLAPDFPEREVFCCGPAPFMRATRGLLADAGFDMAHYHEESFAAAPAVAETDGLAGRAAGGPQAAAQPIRFTLSGVDGTCAAGQTVLQAARTSGVRIPAACEAGLCGTCKVKKRAGSVEMNHNGGILDHEIEDGFILACCSTALSPLEIEA